MTWFKVDDTFESHPKVKAIPRPKRKGAIGLWTLAGSWCARQLTDGHLARHMVAELACSKADADALVAAGLWERTDTGYVFHDWDDWQPTRAKVEADREAARERMKRNRGGGSGAPKGGKKHTPPPTEPQGTSTDVRANTTDGSADVTPTPSRPGPSRPAAAAAQGDAAAAALPAAISILRGKLQAHTPLQALRFDLLDDDKRQQLVALIDLHGDDRLVHIAMKTLKTPPPETVQAFFKTWHALPSPGSHLQAITDEPCGNPHHDGGVKGRCVACVTDALTIDRTEATG